MNIKVFNTLTMKKELFIPIESGKVKIYICGITPYNHPHIGNARPYIIWDVIKRYFKNIGLQVFHVQNFTDIDDKIINISNSEKTTWDIIANRYISSYFKIMDKLNILRADVYPRVSEHIPEIINMIENLINKKYAYVVGGNVYYKVHCFNNYGKLSGRSLKNIQNETQIDKNEHKEHPMDFALWKNSKVNEPSWLSPWGFGRPGWHIECSAMSIKYLGNCFDFHGGGSDLIFPHHENEIAQSEAFSGQFPFVRYWLHNGFITVNEEKMSKSQGNFYTLNDILERYSPDVIRYFVVSTHYRSSLDFSNERLDEAERSLKRLRIAIDNLKFLIIGAKKLTNFDNYSENLKIATKYADSAFYQAMNDDFNTAQALSILFGLAKNINIYYGAVINAKTITNYDVVTKTFKVFVTIADILGILFSEKNNEGENKNNKIVDQLIEIIINIRQNARKCKNWAQADSIRKELEHIGIFLEDSPKGIRWKKN